MDYFFCDTLSKGLVCLDEGESTHMVRVLRMRGGERVVLLNGQGQRGWGRVVESRIRGGALVEVERIDDVVRSYSENTCLLLSPPKASDRLEWVVEKCVEVGVGTIQLLRCAHSERHRVNVERLQRVALAALKQCGGSYLPCIEPLEDVKRYLARVKAGEGVGNGEYALGVAHLTEGVTYNDWVGYVASFHPLRKACIAIGPEGGFHKEEIQAFEEAGFCCVSLGQRRLRVESAAFLSVAQAGWYGEYKGSGNSIGSE